MAPNQSSVCGQDTDGQYGCGDWIPYMGEFVVRVVEMRKEGKRVWITTAFHAECEPAGMEPGGWTRGYMREQGQATYERRNK